MFYIIVGFLYYLLSLGRCSQNDGDCRTMEFKTTVEASALFGHVVKSHVVNTLDDCELKCHLEAECMSINFGPGDSGIFLCELSDSDHNLHPEDLKKRDGFIYRPTENFCASNRCSLNGRCQTGFTDEGYRCICSEGFTGEDCSIEIPLGHVSENPGDSCKHVLESGFSVGDGEYWIDPEHRGNPLKVFCDMTIDGGGWLLIANLVIINPNIPLKWSAEKSYCGISNYYNNKMAINRDAMKELRAHLPFTQLRFHCNKRQVGRTFHVTTVANSTGEAVVQYVSGQTDAMPSSCNSFQKMENDNSQLAVQCDLWGKSNGSYYVGKWGHYKHHGPIMMYNHIALIGDKHHWEANNDWLCDDGGRGTMPISAGDFWKIYVR